MSPIILEQSDQESLFPFTETRHIADIRVGILTIREKWERLTGREVRTSAGNDIHAIRIPANILPEERMLHLVQTNTSIDISMLPYARQLEYPWQIFEFNDYFLRQDFKLLTEDRISQAIPESVQVIRSTNIFIEEGARLSHCILNASTGPIYIGKNAEVMEGSQIRGPFALCEGSVVKMGAKIYGATTVGPYSIIGGEVKNSVIFGYSNKAHDGYLGDSVIGEWCNLGAGTSNSNLRNTGAAVKVWQQSVKDYVAAGDKCGLLMGDYSRSAINSAFNTGAVVGVCCNVFTQGLTPKLIPSFTWGIDDKYEFDKALNDIRNWKKMKNHSLAESEIQQLKIIFERS